ncbi:MAG: hypothetical protein WD738_23915 [Pirellulales bacterium]
MNTAELLDTIIETLATPVTSLVEHSDLNAREAAAARKKNASDLAHARELFVQLKAVHPDVLLNKLQSRERELMFQVVEIDKAENRLVAAAAPDSEVQRLTEAIKQSIHDEPNIIQQSLATLSSTTLAERVLPTKFIRADATAHFRVEIDAAEAELAKLNRRVPRTPTSWPAGGVLERMRELEAIIAGWPKQQKLCRLGERIHALREERRRMMEERDELTNKVRREVLAVA